MTGQVATKLVYFAWVRERVGMAEEHANLPAGILTVSDLLDWQKTRGEEYAHAFEHANVIRVALDKTNAQHDAPISGASEIAFFPPMTGG